MKRIIIAILIAAILAPAGAVLAQQRSFKVVGNAATTPDSATARDLERVFLKKRSRWPNGQNAVPVDQKRNAQVREVFSREVLGKDMARVESHWQAQVFAGKGTPPKTMGSDRDVIDFVRSTPGAVGYVSAGASTAGVKVINISN